MTSLTKMGGAFGPCSPCIPSLVAGRLRDTSFGHFLTHFCLLSLRKKSLVLSERKIDIPFAGKTLASIPSYNVAVLILSLLFERLRVPNLELSSKTTEVLRHRHWNFLALSKKGKNVNSKN